MARFGLKIRLKRNDFRWVRYFALACCLGMIFSENRCPPLGQVRGQAFSGSCFDTSAAFLPDGYGGWWSRGELNP